MTRLGFVGAGKVGTTLARLWYEAGCEISAIHSRTYANAAKLALALDAQVVGTASDVVNISDLTFLTVPDDKISSVAQAIEGGLQDKWIVHTSGVHNARVLSILAQKGAKTGSFHPAYAFARVEDAVTGLEGSTFAIEAEDPALSAYLRELVTVLGGLPLTLHADQKAIYHAALVVASNYTVTLYDVAMRLLRTLQADEATAKRAVDALMVSTLKNLAIQGTPDALTGPLVRGDVDTIEKHLAALPHDVKQLYCHLALQSMSMLRQRGMDEDTIAHLEELVDTT
jgi:predicted short-subunit dehydrogenase-like oxidoreductase (DUF2520 family)